MYGWNKIIPIKIMKQNTGTITKHVWFIFIIKLVYVNIAATHIASVKIFYGFGLQGAIYLHIKRHITSR